MQSRGVSSDISVAEVVGLFSALSDVPITPSSVISLTLVILLEFLTLFFISPLDDDQRLVFC